MNTPRQDPSRLADLPASLRLQLRTLCRDAAPQRDLWPGIAERLAGKPTAALPPARRPDAPRRFAAFAWLATAASVLVAIAIGGRLQAPTGVGSYAQQSAAAPMLLRQADAMDREYQAALREVQAARPAVARDRAHPGFAVLDRGVAETRAALQRHPHAVFLLEQLHRLQAQRLSLTRSPALPF